MKHSEALEKLLAQYADLENDADASCTDGFDNDGSTGFEIFENGFELAEKAKGRQVFYACSNNYSDLGRTANADGCCYFFTALEGETEEKLLRRLECRAKEQGYSRNDPANGERSSGSCQDGQLTP